MKISVAMAVCCGEAFIDEQLSSLFAQTPVPDEIIICDDSPDDRMFQQLRPWLTKYPEVLRYVKNPETLGVSANFGKAISLTTGDIILLADQDDFWLPGKIAALCNAITPECQGSFCDSTLTDAELHPLGRTHRQTRGFSCLELKKILSGNAGEFENTALKRFPAAGHNMAFSAAMREKILPIPELPECHDSWIGFTVMLHSRWAVVDEQLTLFRQHSDNTSRAGRYSALQQAQLSASRNAARWYAGLFQELTARANGDVPEKYRARLHYSRQRGDLPELPLLRRISVIFRLLLNGSYFRFGRGFLTAAQDLLFTCKS